MMMKSMMDDPDSLCLVKECRELEEGLKSLLRCDPTKC